MSNQAENSIALYAGQDANKIEKLLRIQHSSVVNELKEHFGAKDIPDLAFRLSTLKGSGRFGIVMF